MARYGISSLFLPLMLLPYCESQERRGYYDTGHQGATWSYHDATSNALLFVDRSNTIYAVDATGVAVGSSTVPNPTDVNMPLLERYESTYEPEGRPLQFTAIQGAEGMITLSGHLVILVSDAQDGYLCVFTYDRSTKKITYKASVKSNGVESGKMQMVSGQFLAILWEGVVELYDTTQSKTAGAAPVLLFDLSCEVECIDFHFGDNDKLYLLDGMRGDANLKTYTIVSLSATPVLASQKLSVGPACGVVKPVNSNNIVMSTSSSEVMVSDLLGTSLVAPDRRLYVGAGGSCHISADENYAYMGTSAGELVIYDWTRALSVDGAIAVIDVSSSNVDFAFIRIGKTFLMGGPGLLAVYGVSEVEFTPMPLTVVPTTAPETAVPDTTVPNTPAPDTIAPTMPPQTAAPPTPAPETLPPVTLQPPVIPTCQCDEVAYGDSVGDASCVSGAVIPLGVRCSFFTSTPLRCSEYDCTTSGWVEVVPCSITLPSVVCKSGAAPPCPISVEEDSLHSQALQIGKEAVLDETMTVLCRCTTMCSVAWTAKGGFAIEAAADYVGVLSIECDVANTKYPQVRATMGVVVLTILSVNDEPQAVAVAAGYPIGATQRDTPAQFVAFADVLAGPSTAQNEMTQVVTGSCNVPDADVLHFANLPTLMIAGTTAVLSFTVSANTSDRTIPVQCSLHDSLGASAILPTVLLYITRIVITPPAQQQARLLSSLNIRGDGVALLWQVEGAALLRDAIIEVSGPDNTVILNGPGVPSIHITTSMSKERSEQGLLARLTGNETEVNTIHAEIVQEGVLIRFADKGYMAMAPNSETLGVSFLPDFFDVVNAKEVCGDSLCGPHAPLTLEAEEPHLPDEAMIGTSTFVVGGVAASMAMAMPASTSSGTKTGVLALASRAMLCPSNKAGTLDRTLNPLGLVLGDDDFKHFNGAVFGAVVVCALLVACCAAVAGYFYYRYRDDVKRQPHLREWSTRYLWANARFGWVTIPMTFLYSGAVLSSATAVVYSPTGFAVLGAVIFCAIGVGFPTYAYFKAKRSVHYQRVSQCEDESWVGKLFWGKVEWQDRDIDGASIWVSMHHLVYDAYTERWRYFLSIELTFLATLAVLTAWNPTTRGQCWFRAMAMTISTAIFSLLILIARPYLAPYENVIEFLITVMETLMLSFTMIAMGSDELNPAQHWGARASSSLGLAAVWLIIVKFVLDTTIFVIDEWNEWKKDNEPSVSRFLLFWFCFVGTQERMDAHYNHNNAPHLTSQSHDDDTDSLCVPLSTTCPRSDLPDNASTQSSDTKGGIGLTPIPLPKGKRKTRRKKGASAAATLLATTPSSFGIEPREHDEVEMRALGLTPIEEARPFGGRRHSVGSASVGGGMFGGTNIHVRSNSVASVVSSGSTPSDSDPTAQSGLAPKRRRRSTASVVTT